MVIIANIADYNVHCIFIDNENSVDILYFAAFTAMGLIPKQLNKFNILIQGFSESSVISEGTIRLPLTVGTRPKQVTIHVDFLVLNLPSAYNVILGRPSLGTLKAVVSSYHLIMKFSMEARVGQVRGNQAVPRQCFAAKLQAEEQLAVPQLELPIDLDARDDLAGEHA
ncbi:uncharacterized protein [Elaeis guineensis]|uniref:uncharacterized protein n=1 Tax=Elaeis guineensis var. tenera TaxID=51953 RepID=UPI003C6CE40F